MSARVLFVGLDSAEPDSMLRWIDAGLLPTLQSLQQNGVWATLEAPPGFGNGVAWPSLFTGANPGRHGRYYCTQLQPGTYRTAAFGDDDFKRPPFWETVSEAGRTVAVIDVNRAPLSRHLNGIQLANWMAHDRVSDMASFPPELAAQVRAQFGDDPFGGSCEAKSRTLDDYRRLAEGLVRRVETKTRLSVEFLKQRQWDLFMVTFADSHDVGHQIWHLHDPTHPKHDPEWVSKFGDPVLAVYQALDSAIKRLTDEAGEQATVVVFGGPGMAPLYTGNFMLEEILARLNAAADDRRTIMDNLKAVYRLAVPRGLRRWIRSSLDPVAQRADAATRSHQKSFVLPHNDNAGAIRVNVVGRDPCGRINPGEEYEQYCAQLTRDLLDLVKVPSGEPLVEKVLRPADLYEGEYSNQLPDLLVVWNRRSPISQARSDKIGLVKPKVIPSRTGDHTSRCIFFSRAPGAEPGRLSGDISVQDLAPTMASVLGVQLKDIDGTPISALLSPPEHARLSRETSD